ncbi:MAG: coth protein-domain-containing protein [Benjaminiella poitrasii]|nr:MAG: coth protein-domain-containing protein [Benjaminiella poitrasii]
MKGEEEYRHQLHEESYTTFWERFDSLLANQDAYSPGDIDPPITIPAVSLLTAAVTLTSIVSAAVVPTNTTYKVLSLVPNNETLGVVVDGTVYPLTSVSEESTLLHMGSAPIASRGYNYAILDKQNSNIIEKENFTRSPVNNGTLNEFYGRSWNTKTLTQLPTIMDPLPIINRIQSDLHIDGQIPAIHITGNQTAVDFIHANSEQDIDITMNMTYISPNDIKSFEDITMSISGHSTRVASKLSYKIKIPKKHDLYGYRRFKLRSSPFDPSYLKEELGYGIAKSVGLPTTEYSFVRVYINDQAIGLFGLAEQFKNPWIRNEFGDGDKDYNQGTLFVAGGDGGSMPAINFGGLGGNAQASEKKTIDSSSSKSSSDLSYLGTNLTLYSQYYSAKEDPSKGSANYTRLMELTKFISEQPNSTAIDDSVVPHWQEKLDMDSVLRNLAFEIIISDFDAYLSVSNNFMLYEDLVNDRFVMSSQDLDLIMGINAYSSDSIFRGNWTDYPGVTTKPLSSRLILVPEFKKEMDSLILNYTKELVNPDVMFPRIDDLYDMLKDEVAWDMSLPRVKNGFDMLSMNEETLKALDPNVSNETIQAITSGKLFELAVNGPLNMTTVTSLKEWLTLRSSNILTFFNQTSV